MSRKENLFLIHNLIFSSSNNISLIAGGGCCQQSAIKQEVNFNFKSMGEKLRDV